MNAQQKTAYAHPMALADGALPPAFMTERSYGRYGYRVGLSLNK